MRAHVLVRASNVTCACWFPYSAPAAHMIRLSVAAIAAAAESRAVACAASVLLLPLGLRCERLSAAPTPSPSTTRLTDACRNTPITTLTCPLHICLGLWNALLNSLWHRSFRCSQEEPLPSSPAARLHTPRSTAAMQWYCNVTASVVCCAGAVQGSGLGLVLWF